ncbi:hypothetical protein SYK_27900 [Pseudodesulfovibrio nedwellii]|uniref:Uncharacterized protein n=1 Tax=Pseudodesulfovibrio nedwellii TaxID=2973072 RepID=A0ABN6S5D1_9BACT|nr:MULTISPECIES: hypothetical protein [Pseudodesulfovibrio]BDQ38430.1 hypothetical protein SYK_27900 [Pseudodesulfovibrio nedwellii]
MAKDFREYLVEVSRHETFGRVFKEVAVGSKVLISFQASNVHGCYPEETLDDVYAYTHWEVSLRSTKPAIDVPKAGAWEFLKHNYWAKPFDKPDFQRAIAADNVPAKHCQRILEDVIEYALLKGQLESEDDIRLIEQDEEVKKYTKNASVGCSGCGGGQKTIEKKAD